MKETPKMNFHAPIRATKSSTAAIQSAAGARINEPPKAPKVTLEQLFDKLADDARAIDPSVENVWLYTDETVDGPRHDRVVGIHLQRALSPSRNPLYMRAVDGNMVEDLIKKHETAWRAFEASCDAADTVSPLYGGAVAERRWTRLEKAEGRALHALVRSAPRDNAARQRKAGYLLDLLVHKRLSVDEQLVTELLISMITGNGKVRSIPDPDQAILDAYETWRAAYDAMSRSDEDDGPAFEALRLAELKVVKMEPVTARGLAVQFEVFTSFGEFEASASRDHDFGGTVGRIAGVEPPETHPIGRQAAAA